MIKEISSSLVVTVPYSDIKQVKKAMKGIELSQQPHYHKMITVQVTHQLEPAQWEKLGHISDYTGTDEQETTNFFEVRSTELNKFKRICEKKTSK